MAPDTPPDQADHSDFYAAAIYGSIVSAALLAAFHEEHVPATGALAALLSTAVVFWIAHAWSTIVAERIHFGLAFTVRQALHVAGAEWPLVEATLLPSVALVLGWAGALSDQLALDVATAVCLVQLLGWGFAVGLRAYHRTLHAVVAGAANGAFGIALVALEVAIIHQ